MYHGATAFTRTPSLAHSHARYFVRMFIAPFVIAYTAPLCMLTSDATLLLKTTDAEDAARRRGWNIWHSANDASRFASMSARYSADVNSVVGFRMLNPTLLTRMSSSPSKRARTSRRSASRAFGSVTSHALPDTSVSPSARHARTAASTSARVRAHRCTFAPAVASERTIAAPRPFVPPVTSARLPSRRNGGIGRADVVWGRSLS